MLIDEIFHSDVTFTFSLLSSAKAIFLKLVSLNYSFLNMIPYTMTNMPGIKEGVSGTTVVGYNLGIDGNIPKKKIESSSYCF